jgi:diaminohydroxyphosphoribosylaminopyrimidine deaminase/5-amino-6-(5-phosphoribosylamino)uracil reductase
VDLPAMMRWLAREHVNEVHVEAGAGLSGALVSAGCVDELLLYLAPVLLGDAAGMVRLPMLEHLEGARRYEFIDAERMGADLRVRARVADTWRELMRQVELPALS